MDQKKGHDQLALRALPVGVVHFFSMSSMIFLSPIRSGFFSGFLPWTGAIFLPRWSHGGWANSNVLLVGGWALPLWKIMEFVNGVGIVPYMENHPNVWNHQPGYLRAIVQVQVAVQNWCKRFVEEGRENGHKANDLEASHRVVVLQIRHQNGDHLRCDLSCLKVWSPTESYQKIADSWRI